MTVPRKTKQLGKKVDRKLSVIKRKVVKKRSVVGSTARRVARTSGAKSITRKTTGAKRTTPSKARKAGEAVGTFLGKAIGNAERIINRTAETAKGILS